MSVVRLTKEKRRLLRLRALAATAGPWACNSYSRVDTVNPAFREAWRQFQQRLESEGWDSSDRPLTQKERDDLHDLEPVICHVPAHHGDTAVGRHAADAWYIAEADPQAILGLLDQLDEAEKEISSLADGQPKSVSTWGSIQDNGLYLVRAIGQRADGNLYLGGNDRVCKGWQVKQLMERCYAALAIPEWPGLPAKEVPLSD